MDRERGVPFRAIVLKLSQWVTLAEFFFPGSGDIGFDSNPYP
jgi:hypothetical protein